MTNRYARDVSHIATLDPYRLQELYRMHPCAEHVVKKLLVAGEREGGKDLDHDISDCIRTLTRWQDMRAEDASRAGTDATHSESAGRELVSRYKWEGKPPETQWAATDADGRVYYYSKKPHIAGDYSVGWSGSGICGGLILDIGIDWRKSLEARPQ